MKQAFLVLPVLVLALLLSACQPTKGPITAVPTAAPEIQTASLSGVVNLNGPVVQDSSILMLQRQLGEIEYTEFDRLPAEDGVTFSWDRAVAGQTYEITAAGQVDETNQVISNAVTVTAPESDIVLTINTKLNLKEPSDQPSVVCGNPDGTNHFNAKLSYPPIPNAKQYYATVGTSAGANDTEAKLLSAKANVAAEMTVYLAKETGYFTRYAYTYCTDCDQEDQQNWSGYSPTLGFRCP